MKGVVMEVMIDFYKRVSSDCLRNEDLFWNVLVNLIGFISRRNLMGKIGRYKKIK